MRNDFQLESIDFVTRPSFGDQVTFSKGNLIKSSNYLFTTPLNKLIEEEVQEAGFYQARKNGFRGTFELYKTIVQEDQKLWLNGTELPKVEAH